MPWWAEVRASAPAELWAWLELNPAPQPDESCFPSSWAWDSASWLLFPMESLTQRVSCLRVSLPVGGSLSSTLSLQPCRSLSPGAGCFLPTPAPKSSGEIGGSWSAGISKSLLFCSQNTNPGVPVPPQPPGRPLIISHTSSGALGPSRFPEKSGRGGGPGC